MLNKFNFLLVTLILKLSLVLAIHSTLLSVMASLEKSNEELSTHHPVLKSELTSNRRILVTGGAGFIATHTIICLLEAGYDVTVVDNLINSSEEGNKIN